MSETEASQVFPHLLVLLHAPSSSSQLLSIDCTFPNTLIPLRLSEDRMPRPILVIQINSCPSDSLKFPGLDKLWALSSSSRGLLYVFSQAFFVMPGFADDIFSRDCPQLFGWFYTKECRFLLNHRVNINLKILQINWENGSLIPSIRIIEVKFGVTLLGKHLNSLRIK